MLSFALKANSQTGSFLRNRFGLCTSLFMAILCLVMTQHPSLEAAPPSRNPNYYPDANAQAIREIRDSLEGLKHEVKNHEAEIRMFDEKLANVDPIVEGVRDQFGDLSKSLKDQLRSSTAANEEKITSLDTTTKGLTADVRQFKTHANDVTTALAQYKQKIAELEKALELQNQNIEHLQTAMKSLMDALQVKESTSSKNISDNTLPGNSYRVKSGDSLEKIARNNNTTIQAIKDLNGMTTDRIVVGKVIKLPEN